MVLSSVNLHAHHFFHPFLFSMTTPSKSKSRSRNSVKRDLDAQGLTVCLHWFLCSATHGIFSIQKTQCNEQKVATLPQSKTFLPHLHVRTKMQHLFNLPRGTSAHTHAHKHGNFIPFQLWTSQVLSKRNVPMVGRTHCARLLFGDPVWVSFSLSPWQSFRRAAVSSWGVRCCDTAIASVSDPATTSVSSQRWTTLYPTPPCELYLLQMSAFSIRQMRPATRKATFCDFSLRVRVCRTKLQCIGRSVDRYTKRNCRQYSLESSRDILVVLANDAQSTEIDLSVQASFTNYRQINIGHRTNNLRKKLFAKVTKTFLLVIWMLPDTHPEHTAKRCCQFFLCRIKHEKFIVILHQTNQSNEILFSRKRGLQTFFCIFAREILSKLIYLSVWDLPLC